MRRILPRFWRQHRRSTPWKRRHLRQESVTPPRPALRRALSSVQGIYLIADSSNGKQYLGKADGSEGILGRWRAYAGDGHGGNMALRQLAGVDPSHRMHFVFSILRVFGPEALKKDLSAAEAHYKDALLSRTPSR